MLCAAACFAAQRAQRECEFLLPQLRIFVTATANFCYPKAALFRENTRFSWHKILHKSYKTYKTCNSLPPALDGGGGFAYNENVPGAAPTQSKGFPSYRHNEPRANPEIRNGQGGGGKQNLCRSRSRRPTEATAHHTAKS